MKLIDAFAALCNAGMFVWVMFLIAAQPPHGDDVLLAAAWVFLPVVNFIVLAPRLLRKSDGSPSMLQLLMSVWRAKLERQLTELKR